MADVRVADVRLLSSHDRRAAWPGASAGGMTGTLGAALIVALILAGARAPNVVASNLRTAAFGSALLTLGVLTSRATQAAREQRALAKGLALAYFYNFVLPFAASLRQSGADDDASPGDGGSVAVRLRVERQRGVFETARVSLAGAPASPRLHVLVPRGPALPPDAPESDAKALLTAAMRAGTICAVEPEVKAAGAERRPLFAHLYPPAQQQRSAIVFDVPTIVSTIGYMARDQPTAPSAGSDEAKAVETFASELGRLCARHPATRAHVRLVSVPPLPFDLAAALGSLGEQLDA